MTTPFAIPGLMHPILHPEQYRAVSVVDSLDLVVLEIPTPVNPVAPRVELRSRGGAYLHRVNLGPQFLVSEDQSGLTRFRLRWPVDVRPNDYELFVIVGEKLEARIPFNVAPPPKLQLEVPRCPQ